MTKIKKEVMSEVMYHKDIFLNHGIILEDFHFEINERYERLLKEPFLGAESSVFYLRIPLEGISKNVFEFSIYLNLGFEPNISYSLYQNILFIKKPEVSLEVPFSDSFVEENFKGNWSAFRQYALPVLKEYFAEGEVEMFLGVVGGVSIDLDPYIRYTEIII
jgi:hypothetical protein